MSLQLRILQGHNQGQVLPLSGRSILLGRATTMGEAAPGFLFFYEATVSRQHAELCWDEKRMGYVLHQRSQTNKTLLDKYPVEPQVPKLVNVGSIIQMGLLVLVLESV